LSSSIVRVSRVHVPADTVTAVGGGGALMGALMMDEVLAPLLHVVQMFGAVKVQPPWMAMLAVESSDSASL
jgi:hypothetical protein